MTDDFDATKSQIMRRHRARYYTYHKQAGRLVYRPLVAAVCMPVADLIYWKLLFEVPR